MGFFMYKKNYEFDKYPYFLLKNGYRSSLSGTEVSNNTEGTHLIANRQEMKKLKSVKGELFSKELRFVY